jgi:pilus assembly protein Flp/PilA
MRGDLRSRRDEDHRGKSAGASQIINQSRQTAPTLAVVIYRCFTGQAASFRPMIALVQKFWADETAATAIEYGLIAAGISLAIIAVVNGIGSKLNTKFASINTSLK